MVDAVRVLREVEAQQRQFHDDVQLGIDQLERGDANEYTPDQMWERFERLKDRTRQRIADAKDCQ